MRIDLEIVVIDISFFKCHYITKLFSYHAYLCKWFSQIYVKFKVQTFCIYYVPKNHVPRLVKGFFKVDIQTATAIEL